VTVDISSLIANTLKGDSVSLARLISFVENEDKASLQILKSIYPYRKRAHRVGITGPPGVGKSTLVDRLALLAREQGMSVGVICVDPTSPFTGGALLGDRIRMSKASSDPGVFIRSMATRGSLGGIARTTESVAEVMEAAGKQMLFIETVGVGQSELDIFHAVDTVVVVLVPESGTGVQAMKAGLMEIAHLFVINKADRAGAERMREEIEDVLSLAPAGDWEVKVFLTQAYRGIGVKEVFSRILEHKIFLESKQNAEENRLKKIEKKLRDLVKEKVDKELLEQNGAKEAMKYLVFQIAKGELDPYTAADSLLQSSFNTSHAKT
jgi:LAO/AO transport system kinase